MVWRWYTRGVENNDVRFRKSSRAGRYTNFGDGTVFYKISRYK